MSDIVIVERRKGRKPLDKAPKEKRPKGRPCKFASEEEKKEARKAYIREYYKKNSEHILEQHRTIYHENREIINEVLSKKLVTNDENSMSTLDKNETETTLDLKIS